MGASGGGGGDECRCFLEVEGWIEGLRGTMERGMVVSIRGSGGVREGVEAERESGGGGWWSKVPLDAAGSARFCNWEPL